MLLAVMTCGLCLLSADANVFVSDRREQRDPRAPILRSVGVLKSPYAEGGGTAFLVGECHIMTAYHVVFAREKNAQTGDVKTVRGKVGSQGEFYIGLSPDKPMTFEEMTTATVVDFGNYVKRDFHGMTGDWAILRLDTCLGRKYGHLSVARPDERKPMPTGDLMTVSFPLSRKDRAGISVEENCSAREWGPVLGLIGIDCATEGGMSGAPVLERQPKGGWLVVGILQMSMSNKDDVLPKYSTQHRNQAVYLTAFAEALEKVLAEPAPK